MIRFNCPACQRPYELPDALAALPLVCKQCGQRITPPAPTPDPPPAPPPPPPPQAAPKPAPPKAAPAKPQAAPPPPPAPAKPQPAKPVEPVEDDDVLVAKPDETPDIDFNIGGPTAASLSDAARARQSSAEAARASAAEINLDLLGLPPAPPPKPVAPAVSVAPAPEPAAPVAEPTVLPFLADLGVLLLLVFGGLLLGEVATRKPMGQVFTEAGSAAKFPPVDLLLLLAPPATFGLIYLLLNSREKTVGAWLRRRSRPQ